MHWIVASEGPWLIPFVPGDRHQFEFVPPPSRSTSSWHARGRSRSGAADWAATFSHASRAWRRRRRPGGIITLFPQAAAAVGLRKRASLGRPPVVAHNFNLGRLYGGVAGSLARFAMRGVDRFVVHARRERGRYADWLGLPEDRFRFVPLQCGAFRALLPEDADRPFLLAMGSAHRDYRSLFEAVGRLGIPTVVVAGPHALEGLSPPPCVEVRSGLSMAECRELAQRARLSVVPIANDRTASGQVTVVEAMRMGRPVIATRCIGTEDYVDSGENGVLVPIGSADDLARSIAEVWEDDALRARLSASARRHADLHFSDEAAGEALGALLDELDPQAPRPA